HLCRKHIVILLDGQDLSAHQTGHAHPVQQGEHHEHGKHVRSDLLQKRNGFHVQHLVEHHGKQDHHQRIRKGIDDIHDTHHDQVNLAAEVSGDTSIYITD